MGATEGLEQENSPLTRKHRRHQALLKNPKWFVTTASKVGQELKIYGELTCSFVVLINSASGYLVLSH